MKSVYQIQIRSGVLKYGDLQSGGQQSPTTDSGSGKAFSRWGPTVWVAAVWGPTTVWGPTLSNYRFRVRQSIHLFEGCIQFGGLQYGDLRSGGQQSPTTDSGPGKALTRWGPTVWRPTVWGPSVWGPTVSNYRF